MIEIEGKIVDLDIFRVHFVCDLAACEGACCVEGAAGAPLTDEELIILKDEYEAYKPYMTPEGIEAVEEVGFSVKDYENEETTPLIHKDRGACAYSFNENMVTMCAIERAWYDGKTEFKKPISCHLYPIRVTKYSSGGEGLNYQKWHICNPALGLGDRMGTPVYKSLKEAIERAWGEEFYKELDNVYKELVEQGVI